METKNDDHRERAHGPGRRHQRVRSPAIAVRVSEPLQEWEQQLIAQPQQTFTPGDAAQEISRLRNQVEILNLRSRNLADERDRAYQERNAFETDLRRTNEVLNTTAKRRDWCGEYESQMEALNESLISDFQFKPRARDFEVEVTLTSTFTRWITVEAMDSDDARQIVDDLSNCEVHDKMGLSWNYSDSNSDDVEINSVSESS